MNKISVFAIICMILIVSTPLASAASQTNIEKYRENDRDDPRNLGEVLVINVDKIQPDVVTSDLLSSRNFEVRVFLSGQTLGTMLFGNEAPIGAPFYGDLKIRNINFELLSRSQFVRGISSSYVPRGEKIVVSPNGNIDLGYIKLLMTPIRDERDIPDEPLELEVRARVYFDVTTGFGDFSAANLYLVPSKDEESWLNNGGREGMFWAGTGYLRLIDINGDRATFQVYDGSFRKINKVSLREGESKQITLPGAPRYLDNAVTIKLNKISSSNDRAKLLITRKNGKVESREFIEGMLVAGDWRVDSILDNAVIFKDEDGNKRVLKKKNDGAKSCNNIKEVSDSEVDKASSLELYCKAIKEYEMSIENIGNINSSILFDDYIGLAQTYEILLNFDMASLYYTKAKELDEDKFKFYEGALKAANERLNGGYDVENLDGNLVSLISTSVGENQKNSVKLKVDGEINDYKEGESLFEGITDNEGNRYNWKIDSINSDSIVIKQYFTKRETNPSQETITISVGEDKQIPVDGGLKTVTIKDISITKGTVVTVYPGTKDNYGTSYFTIHLPIEKRLIQWTPEQIDKKIEATDKRIEKLDNIIDKLTNVIKTWKGLCYGVFAFLTVKNAFFHNPMGRRLAVEKVENECKGMFGNDQEKIDECIRGKSDEIEELVDKYESVVDSVKERVKDVDWNKPEEVKKLASSINGLNETELELLYKYDKINADKVRDLMVSTEAGEDVDVSELKDELSYLSKLDEKIKDEGLSWDKPEDRVKIQVIEESLRDGARSSSVDVLLGDRDDIARQELVNKDVLTTSEGEPFVVRKDDNGYYIWENGVRVNVEEYKYNGDVLTSSKGQFYKANGKVYLGIYDPNEFSKYYAFGQEKIFYDKDSGKPQFIPIKEERTIPGLEKLEGYANYVAYNLEARDGEYPFSIWNVGYDGKINTVDDRPVYTSDEIEANINLRNYVERIYQQARISVGEGEKVRINGKDYVASFIVSKAENDVLGECRYIMPETDCKILFGVCDPVMCPVSRFNFGGKWDVGPSVVESGIIGSLVLGLPNFDIPYEPVPICLTGINAGLENLRSVQEGYKECLEKAKTTGESVGICNEIRSLYMCDLLWNEALSMVNAFGSLNGWISEKIFGKSKASGGGEYLSWDSSWKQLSKSVNFFTKEYATSAFAAFTSRSTKEVGTEICKQAIFGKYPAGGDLLAQLTEPESPPQFTGWFEEDRYSYTPEEGARSAYRVYYHIYAGRHRDIRYAVYLKNDFGRRVYVTNGEYSFSGYRLLRRGESVDKSFTITNAMPGLNNMCIVINGRESCGFGSVSSNFALQYVKEYAMEKDLSKNITTAEQCRSGSSYYTPGFVESGIKRICAVNDPDGVGDSWVKVGSCGVDELGRPLGECYLYKKGINLYNTNYTIAYENVSRVEEFSQDDLVKAESKVNSLKLNKDNLPELRKIINSDFSSEITAKAQYKVGEIYYLLAGERAKKEFEEEKKKAEADLAESCDIYYDGDSFGSSDEVSFRFVDGKWTITPQNYGEIKVRGYGPDMARVVKVGDVPVIRLTDVNYCEVLNIGDKAIYELCKKLVGVKDFGTGVSLIVEQANSEKDDTIKVVHKDGDILEFKHGEADSSRINIMCLGENIASSSSSSGIDWGICGQYADEIERYAKEYKVDPKLVMAIMMQESGCNVNACNSDGCYGLMQITENAYNEDCKDLANSFEEINRPENYEKNIECGIRHLKSKYNEFREGVTESTTYKNNEQFRKLVDNCISQYPEYGAYKGWEAALRAYNGWGCSAGADVDYVEHVLNKLGIIETPGLFNQQNQETQNKCELYSKEECDNKEGCYLKENRRFGMDWLSKDSCEYCNELQNCQDIKDKDKCNSGCDGLASISCEWNSDKEVCQEKSSFPAENI